MAKFLGVAVALAVASLLPIIPIQRAPVVPHPSYSLCFKPIITIFNPFILGVRYQAQWYTLVSMFLLVVAAVVLGLQIGKALSGKKGRTSE